MTKIACIFPGQGTQKVGMCAELFKASAIAREVFAEVDDSLNTKLSKIIFEGPEEELMQTQNTQPALLACSIATLRVLEQEGGKKLREFCAYAAGHSLGEFTALVAANSISLRECARLLRARGLAMQEAPGGSMFALLGGSFDIAMEIVHETGVQIANDNAPSQQVLSGTAADIDKAANIAQKRGLKVIKLNVSGAFHSRLMESAKPILEEALEAVKISSPNITLISNVSGDVMSHEPSEIKRALLEQLTSTVRWCDSIKTLKCLGTDVLVEVGPGTVYTNLTKKIDAELQAIALINLEAINLFIAEYLSQNIIKASY
jgi:[acyl-carrier-protein] S-malonyltransferase